MEFSDLFIESKDNKLVSSKHQYRKFKELFDFEVALEALKSLESPANYKAYGVFTSF